MIRHVLLLMVLLMAAGCAVERTFTIQTIPPDASIRIDGVDRGPGPVTERLRFESAEDDHSVTVQRSGFKDQTRRIRRDEANTDIVITLRPETKNVKFVVEPVPAELRIDGTLVTPGPITNWSDTLEFTKDARENWREYKVTAERNGFARAEAIVRFPDRDSTYVLTLGDLTKDLNVTSEPAGATIWLDGEEKGRTPLVIPAVPFPYVLAEERTTTRKMRIERPGYDAIERDIGWAEGMTDVHINLAARNKTVKIVTEPANATIALDSPDQPTDIDNGNPIYHLAFPPTNEQGDLRVYTATISKEPVDGSEWRPTQIQIGWDEGKAEYQVSLDEILTTPVLLVRPRINRETDGWRIVPDRIETIALKDTSEDAGRKVERIVASQPGEVIDTLTLSPNDNTVAYSVLYDRTQGDFVSQIRAIRQGGSEQQLTDNRSLYLMPSFAPDGKQVLFSSNRFSRRQSILAISLDGTVGISQLTRDGFDLWPSLDSSPEAHARLYYQRMLDTREDPRLFWSPKLAGFPTDLLSGMQPRVSPMANAIVYVGINEHTGKRDIFLLRDEPGAAPQNLTNTPDIDEYDPAFSRDGGRIAFVSDEASHSETGRNFDIWVMDLRQPGKPTQITSNGSWDDSPVWDATNSAIYFRSNRGGNWGIWKLDLR